MIVAQLNLSNNDILFLLRIEKYLFLIHMLHARGVIEGAVSVVDQDIAILRHSNERKKGQNQKCQMPSCRSLLHAQEGLDGSQEQGDYFGRDSGRQTRRDSLQNLWSAHSLVSMMIQNFLSCQQKRFNSNVWQCFIAHILK